MKKLPWALLLLLLLCSCYLPPYQEQLSLALTVTDKMEGVAIVGPLDASPWEYQGWDVVFYPSRDALRNTTSDITRGFIVATSEHKARLIFVDHVGEYQANSSDEFPIENVDDNEFVFQATPLRDGADDGIERLALIIFENKAEIRDYFEFNENITMVLGPEPMNLGPELLIGASFFHDDGSDAVILNTLRIDPGDLYFEEFHNTDPLLPLGPPGNPVPARTGFPLPGLPKDINNAFYYSLPLSLSPTQRAYFSVYDPVRLGYRNFSWDVSLGLQVITEMDRRIDLLLSNGWLFSRDGNKGYVYNGNGEEINNFVLGGLSLVYEIYDGAMYRVVFTIPVWARVPEGPGNWQDKLFFLVYWIPTEQLADL
jgi:hypothetical protein